MTTNVMLDTGAGLSIIDMGTLEHMKLVPYIDTTTNYAVKCLDASGSNMNIIGSIELNTELVGTNLKITHMFRVLNAKSGRSIIIGRDLMRKYGNVEFDFTKNIIRVGEHWLKGILPQKQSVRLCDDVTITPRSEVVVEVRCNKNKALVPGEFVPKAIMRIKAYMHLEPR